jgi:hypothetical protein
MIVNYKDNLAGIGISLTTVTNYFKKVQTMHHKMALPVEQRNSGRQFTQKCAGQHTYSGIKK